MIDNNKDVLWGIKQTQSVTTRYHSNAVPHRLDMTVDFSLATVDDVTRWAMRERVITFQKVLRNLPDEEAFQAFHSVGPSIDFLAIEAGVPLDQHSDLEDIISNIQNLNL